MADDRRGAPAGTTPEALYAQGVLMRRAGRRQEAVGLLDAALRAKPDFPEALCMGGYILGESGKREAALQFYRRKAVTAFINRTLLYEEAKRRGITIAPVDRTNAIHQAETLLLVQWILRKAEKGKLIAAGGGGAAAR